MPELDPDLIFMQWLLDQGYRDVKPISPRRYACIRPLLFTHAIASGRIGDGTCFDDRWCYAPYERVNAALDAWDWGEPGAWHRHPGTGRRRMEGVVATQYVDP